MKIQIKGQDVEIQIRRNRRSKRLRLAVYPGGEVTLTAPYSMSEKKLELLSRTFILGKEEWLFGAIEKLKKHVKKPKRSNAEIRKEYMSHKVGFKKLAIERLKHFNEHYGFKIGNISIRNQKSRWGSCSRKGNLNFNYRIALLPSKLADYIFVHELCHIGQMNHSYKFWDLVAETIPDHKKLRKELKKDFSLI